jgi:predicted ABC-type transport system involved in lysophospholipase L1 biosynthesis ATPase subunit
VRSAALGRSAHPSFDPVQELAQALLEALGLGDDLHHAPRAIGDVVGVQLVGDQ